MLAVLSCQKEGGGGQNNNGNGNSNNNNGNNNGNPDTSSTQPKPSLAVTRAPVTIYLPNNCQTSFTITNNGPKGSQMDYSVADDGSLGGFLSFSPQKGTLASGASTTVYVSILPAFTNSQPSLVGASLVLDVYTPKASNYTKFPVPVKVLSINSVASSLLGTWSGAWAGNSFGRNNPMQATQKDTINGTWLLNITAVDTAAKTASGSLTWNGSDAYWIYTYNTDGTIATATPQPFIPNRTIQFDASNTTFTYDNTTGMCNPNLIHLTINGFANQPNPSDGFYGPQLNGFFDVQGKTVTSQGVGFSAHPYNPANFDTGVSNGSISGKKQ